ncbi:MAG TPA: hypothetical protein VNT75_04215, partial [Symbiobacteriaceae bacterium]|nr:hypothetical protein [Symbiobacteriaceae bacterium]
MVRPPIFLPGLGAFVGFQPGASPLDETLVILGGPVVGGIAALIARQVGVALGQPALAFAGDFSLVVNLMNLAPVRPLDGGRVAGKTGWLGYLPAVAVLVMMILTEDTFFMAGSFVVIAASSLQRIHRDAAPSWRERITIFYTWLGASALLAVPLLLTDRVPSIRAVPQPFQKAARIFAWGLFGFYVLGQYAWRTALARGQTAVIRYGLLTFVCWLVPVMNGSAWLVPISALALAECLGLPGLRWLGSLLNYMAAKGNHFCAAACAAGYDCLVRLGRLEPARAWLAEKRPLVVRGGPRAVQALFSNLES